MTDKKYLQHNTNQTYQTLQLLTLIEPMKRIANQIHLNILTLFCKFNQFFFFLPPGIPSKLTETRVYSQTLS